MRCFNCPDFPWCCSPAQNGGGCDIDGADDFGCGFFEDEGYGFFEDEEDDVDDDDWDF